MVRRRAQGAKILLHTFADDEEEARHTAEQIEFARLARRVPWRDQAILFRTNQQSRPLETALRQAGIRYHLIGGQSYFDRREIKDFLAYLKTFINPHDDISLLRIANVPARGLSDVTMERLLAASHERNCPVFAAMKHTDVLAAFVPRTRDAVAAFREFDRAASGARCARAPFPRGNGRRILCAKLATKPNCAAAKKPRTPADNRVRNLRELLATLGDTAGGTAAQVGGISWMIWPWTPTARRKKKQTGDAVTLITMHSCKGLEFPHVYIVGLEDGLLPHSRSKAEGTLDEERRLFYVALTRAMQTLTLSHCAARKKYGQPMPCHPSPFLKELPADLVELDDDKSKAPVTVEAGCVGFAAMRLAAGAAEESGTAR